MPVARTEKATPHGRQMKTPQASLKESFLRWIWDGEDTQESISVSTCVKADIITTVESCCTSHQKIEIITKLSMGKMGFTTRACNARVKSLLCRTFNAVSKSIKEADSKGSCLVALGAKHVEQTPAQSLLCLWAAASTRLWPTASSGAFLLLIGTLVPCSVPCVL